MQNAPFGAYILRKKGKQMKIIWHKKPGILYAKIKHHSYKGPQLALVHLDGNKRLTRVRYDELIILPFTSEYDSGKITI